MSTEDFMSAIDFIAEHIFPRLGVGQEHFLTVEYLGGEILLIPEDEIREAVSYSRRILGKMVRGYRDGAQSNLIGSSRKILFLHDLFDGNLGTSWDNHTGQRHIQGSPRALSRHTPQIPADSRNRAGTYARQSSCVDSSSASFLEAEVHDAISGGYDLVLRPVFQGGSNAINPSPPRTSPMY